MQQYWVIIGGVMVLLLSSCTDKSLPLKCGDPTWEPGQKWEINKNARDDDKEEDKRGY